MNTTTVDRTRLLFLVPTSLEYRHIVQGFYSVYGGPRPKSAPFMTDDPEGGFTFLLCGIGKKRLKKNINLYLAENRADLLISTGCCGAVHPALSGATPLLPERVINDHGESPPLMQNLFSRLPDAVRCPTLLSVTRPADREAKIRIRQQHPDVWAVDMESYWIAKAAADNGLPAAVLRTTSDTAGDAIPDWGLSKRSGIRSWIAALMYKKRAAKACRTMGRLLARWYLQIKSNGQEGFLSGDDPSPL